MITKYDVCGDEDSNAILAPVGLNGAHGTLPLTGILHELDPTLPQPPSLSIHVPCDKDITGSDMYTPPTVTINQVATSSDDHSVHTVNSASSDEDDHSIASASSGSISLDMDDYPPPPGSLLDDYLHRPQSPLGVDDFSMTADTSINAPLSQDPAHMDKSTDPVELHHPSICRVHGTFRVCYANQPEELRPWERPVRLDRGGLSDTGANICMTNLLELLRNVRPLAQPIAVGVALTPDATFTQDSVCTHVGKLPLPLTNDNY